MRSNQSTEHGKAFRRFHTGGILAFLALASACSPAMEANDTSSSVASTSEELRCVDEWGEPTNDPNCPWSSGWGEVFPDGGGANITNTKSPAVCVASNVLIVSVDTQNHYRTLAFDGEDFATSWGTYGQRTFASSPTCAPQGASSSAFVLAGKDLASNKIYASSGTMGFGSPPPNPVGASFAVVDNSHTYSSGGNPAAASNNSGIVLVTMGTDSRTIYSYWHPLPYAQNSWGPRITGPQLPSGSSAAGTPAIVFLPENQVFHVVVRANNPMFQTYVASGGSFTNGGGQGVSAFDVLGLPGPFSSDPALARSTTSDLETLIYLSNTHLMQTSANSLMPLLGTFPVLAMPGLPTQGQPGGLPNFTGAPAAIGIPLDVTDSAADVFSRFGSRIAFTHSIDVAQLAP
jgi:hypothetical protein